MEVLCNAWSDRPLNHAITSDDLRTQIVQHEASGPPGFTVIQYGDSSLPQTTRIELPNSAYKIQSVHGHAEDLKILLTTENGIGQKFAVTMDRTGKEVGRCELDGTPVCDALCTTVVSIDPASLNSISKGVGIVVKVWLPNKDEAINLSLDPSEVLAGLRAK